MRTPNPILLLLLTSLLAVPLAITACGGSGTLDLDDDDGDDDDDDDSPTVDPRLEGWCTVDTPEFSFFVTSMAAVWAWAEDDINDHDGGLGGNFGGLEGADALCQAIGTATGHGSKTWRAFLSATDDGEGNAVHAIERVGEGPWHDANGRLVAADLDGLLGDERPDGDSQSVDDLPDECGVPLSLLGDSHDVVTGSNEQGRLHSTNPESTCLDWTSDDGAVGSSGGEGNNLPGVVRCGHSWPRNTNNGTGQEWINDHPLRGCGRGANLIQNGAGEGECIGCTGGYGGIYCLAE